MLKGKKKVHTVKDELYKSHKILNNKMNKWSTMAGTFNTTFVIEIILNP